MTAIFTAAPYFAHSLLVILGPTRLTSIDRFAGPAIQSRTAKRGPECSRLSGYARRGCRWDSECSAVRKKVTLDHQIFTRWPAARPAVQRGLQMTAA
jgi:hypothetical protein